MRRMWSALAAAALAACGAGDGLPGAPAHLTELLSHVPDEASQRGLYFGMDSVLPLDGSLGFTAGAVELVLETGAPPFTVLVGDFDAGAVGQAAVASGYQADPVRGWSLYERAFDAEEAPSALVAAVPALAMRGRTLLLGSADEVAAAVADPAHPEWLGRLARALGPQTSQAVMSPPVDIEDSARRLGANPDALLATHGARARLERYLGYGIAHAPDGSGVIAVTYPRGTQAAGQAAAVAQRLATTSILGESARRPADELEPAGPRWLEAAATVRLAVSWHSFDAARLRADAESGALLFLAPSQG